MRCQFYAAMIGLALAGCAGCQKEAPLRTVNPGNLSSRVTLWVANHSLHNEAKRPHIVEAAVSFDGVESKALPTLEAFNSKYGWSEKAEFVAPDTAKTSTIHATVVSYGKTYVITQHWVREDTEGLLKGSWKVESDSIELGQKQEKEKK